MVLATPAEAAIWFLPFAVVIGLYAAWVDFRIMKIPNRVVDALFAVFAIVGFFVLPLDEYMWRWLHFVVVLVIGFVLAQTPILGAGDAKMMAVMAPYIAWADTSEFLMLFFFMVPVIYVLHMIVRAIPGISKAAPNTLSLSKEKRTKFPMGVALGPLLIAYLTLAAFPGLFPSG
ncbi:A24 family peptidase [Actibacterium lipolyticum]|uniref:Type IV leader peptidase family protein n=1 Tax=Actibacterium lipolyticum TaxID=1524263 RepID=A0A238KMT2_9RHOB|nr:prepilin peptidase [Actibacterium lipolyticum]SMX44018.1 Type IV leader peptidase family protein [Actibacterium lipolyticum]